MTEKAPQHYPGQKGSWLGPFRRWRRGLAVSPPHGAAAAETPDAIAPLAKLRRRRSAAVSVLLSVLSVLSVVLLLALAGFGLLLARLSQGPIALDRLAPQVVAALRDRFGNGYQFDLQHASLTRGDEGFSLALKGMSVRDASGRPIVASPAAQLSVDPLALATGELVPKRLEIRDADLNLSILPDGQVAISAGTRGEEPIPLSEALPSLVASPDTPDAASPADSPRESRAPALPGAESKGDFDRAANALLGFINLATRPDSPFGALDRLGISHARLVVEDRAAHRTAIFDGLDLAIDRSDGNARLTFAVDGPNGRWTVKMLVAGGTGNQRRLVIDIADVSPDDLALLSGQIHPGFVLDTPVSGHLEIEFDAQDKLLGGTGRFVLGAGLFKADDRDAEPVLIDDVTGTLLLDSGSRSLNLQNWVLNSGETRIEMAGTIQPPAPGQPGWQFAMLSQPGSVLGPERPGEQPIALDRLELAGRLEPADQRLTLDVLKIKAPELDADFSVVAEGGASPRLTMAGSAQNASISQMTRLWPSTVAAPIRAWFLQHVVAGKIDKTTMALDFDAKTLDLLAHDLAAPDEDLQIDMSLSGASFWFLPGLAPVSGLVASGTITGRHVNFIARQGYIESAPGHRLDISEGSFTMPDTGLKPAPANVNAHMTGNLDTLSALLSTESLKPFVNLPLDPAAIKGQIDGKLTIDLKLGKPHAEDPQVKVAAVLTNFVAEKLVGKEKLDAATLNLSFDRNGVKASGQGRMFGQPALVELKKAGADAGEATISLTLDEASRARIGWGNPGLTGPVSARVVAKMGLVDETQAQVEVDFGKASLDGMFPGFSKPAGKPAKASFAVSGDKDGTTLDNFVFDGGGASLRGAVDIDPDGSFNGAKFSQVKLAAGDDFKAEMSKSADGMKVTLRGNSFDARPVLQNLFNPSPAQARENGQKDIDLDAKLGQVIGQNKQVMSGVDARLSRKGGVARQIQVTGKFGTAAMSASLGAQGQLHVLSDDAGALLSFVDLYKRMEGGDLSATLRLGTGRYDGTVLIHDFLLRDEPALRRLVTEGANVQDTRLQTTAATRFDPGLVDFQKLQVSFVKTGGRIELQDGIMYGPQIGTSLEGVVDFPKNFIDVKGTFVPAYGLNNFFARLPVIGLILGGASHEGLFAVNFRISGPASGPTLNINPLSAIAPGFLRKIFGAGEVPAAFQKPGTGQ